jgi:hypothetical protein
VGVEERLDEVIQEVSRGPVQMLGVAVPWVAVGLAAVSPEPRADDAQGIDRELGWRRVGMGHRGEHLSAALQRAGFDGGQHARESVGAVLGSGRPHSGRVLGSGVVRTALLGDGQHGVRLIGVRAAGHRCVAFGAADDEHQRKLEALSAGH